MEYIAVHNRIFKSIFTLFSAGVTAFLIACSSDQTEVFEPPHKAKELGKATLHLTMGDQSKLLSREPELSRTEYDDRILPTITIDPDDPKQEIDGFGAALTGSSAYLINRMGADQKLALLRDLFLSEDGIGLSYLRMTIGASDFSLSNYTYNDLEDGETDLDLEKFSISGDQEDVVPVFKDILALNPRINIMGSPWSPPAWMKTNNSLMGGELKKETFSVYAEYFVKYLQAYRSEGIPITSISVQNEPLHSTANYPSMYMSGKDQNLFIRDYLGPAFEQQGLNTQIILYDHNWDDVDYPIDILNDPVTKNFVAGTAFHGYAGDVNAMSQVHQAHSDKGLFFTEISGGEWATDFSDNLQWNMRNIFIGATKNWSKNVLLWNLALDENHGPTNNGCGNCRGVVTINSQTGEVSKNVEYYSLGHFSKFIPAGSRRISSQSTGDFSGVDFVSFLNPDGGRVVVIANDNSAARELKIVEGQSQIIYTIPGKSVATITW